MVWIKVIIVLAFIAIVISLFSGLRFILKDTGDSRRAVKALTMRVGLSVGLFAFLMLLVAMGIIEPHGVYPERSAPVTESPTN